MYFHCSFLPGKILLVTTWKNPLLATPGKNPSDARGRVTVVQQLCS